MSPLFEFRCDECGNEFEELVITSKDIVKCEGCGSTSPRKVMSVPAPPIIKGVGGSEHRFIDKNRFPPKAATFAKLPPRPHDMGQGVRVYEMDFGPTERKRLEERAHMDNV